MPASSTFPSASAWTALTYTCAPGAPYWRVHTTWHWASSFNTIKSLDPTELGAPGSAPNGPENEVAARMLPAGSTATPAPRPRMMVVAPPPPFVCQSTLQRLWRPVVGMGALSTAG